MSSRRSDSDAVSNGDSAWSFARSLRAPDSSSSPIGFLQRDGMLCHPQDLAHFLGRDLQLLADLVGARLAPQPLHELALDVHDLVELLDHVDGNANRASLVRDRTRHRLTDPPGPRTSRTCSRRR